MNILIIEDDKDLNDGLSYCLSRISYTIKSAFNLNKVSLYWRNILLMLLF